MEERKQKLEKQLGVYKYVRWALALRLVRASTYGVSSRRRQQIADQEGALAKVSSADAEDQAKVGGHAPSSRFGGCPVLTFDVYR